MRYRLKYDKKFIGNVDVLLGVVMLPDLPVVRMKSNHGIINVEDVLKNDILITDDLHSKSGAFTIGGYGWYEWEEL